MFILSKCWFGDRFIISLRWEATRGRKANSTTKKILENLVWIRRWTRCTSNVFWCLFVFRTLLSPVSRPRGAGLRQRNETREKQSKQDWMGTAHRLGVLFNWVVNLTGLLILLCFSFLFFHSDSEIFYYFTFINNFQVYKHRIIKQTCW